ncbi:hypothetical protein C8J55DRAFT_494244 [Lentinula edodes]|uniref:Elongation factor 2 n=1 Tax=Lentinula lateritia TaxID=40482 RepID=A0A9W8ZPJ7_9AGAR|nr:hypothetical protein C8J55DRAFT_494244 [Lentinula edodes]
MPTTLRGQEEANEACVDTVGEYGKRVKKRGRSAGLYLMSKMSGERMPASTMVRRSTCQLQTIYHQRIMRTISPSDGLGWLYAYVDWGGEWKIESGSGQSGLRIDVELNQLRTSFSNFAVLIGPDFIAHRVQKFRFTVNFVTECMSKNSFSPASGGMFGGRFRHHNRNYRYRRLCRLRTNTPSLIARYARKRRRPLRRKLDISSDTWGSQNIGNTRKRQKRDHTLSSSIGNSSISSNLGGSGIFSDALRAFEQNRELEAMVYCSEAFQNFGMQRQTQDLGEKTGNTKEEIEVLFGEVKPSFEPPLHKVPALNLRLSLLPALPGDLPALLRGLRILEQADPCVETFQMDGGEWVIGGAGELHLEVFEGFEGERYNKQGNRLLNSNSNNKLRNTSNRNNFKCSSEVVRLVDLPALRKERKHRDADEEKLWRNLAKRVCAFGPLGGERGDEGDEGTGDSESKTLPGPELNDGGTDAYDTRMGRQTILKFQLTQQISILSHISSLAQLATRQRPHSAEPATGIAYFLEKVEVNREKLAVEIVLKSVGLQRMLLVIQRSFVLGLRQLVLQMSSRLMDLGNSNSWIQLASLLVDGSPCGYGGTCSSGACRPGSILDIVKAWYSADLQIAIPVTVVGGIVIHLLLYVSITDVVIFVANSVIRLRVKLHSSMRHQRLSSNEFGSFGAKATAG